MMFDRVADDWEKFRIAQTAAVEFGDPITLPQGDNTLLWIGGGLAVVGLALALR